MEAPRTAGSHLGGMSRHTSPKPGRPRGAAAIGSRARGSLIDADMA